jgi:TolB-like protein/Tfp pilus assembly protein PilF
MITAGNNNPIAPSLFTTPSYSLFIVRQTYDLWAFFEFSSGVLCDNPGMTSLFTELKRRNVFRVAIAYLVLSWLVLQVGETLAPALHLPDWVDSLLAFFLILGFPIAIFFAWAFELTPEGLKKEKDVDRSQSITTTTGRKLDFSIIALLGAALVYFIWVSQSNELPSTADEPADVVAASLARFANLIDAPDAAGPSIAVLPFVNMSSDVEQEYFSDGLSEELLNLLAKIPALRVASRTSAFSFKGKDVTIGDVGRELNVGHVLEGSVRKSGTRIRITAQLIDVETDTHLWSETWDRTLDDVFAIQDEIAQVVVEQLRIEILGAAPQVAETSAEAYGLVLQARHNSRRRSVEGYRTAEELLKSALELDPNYAPAWAQLGLTFIVSSQIATIRGARESAALGIDAAKKALELDPNNTQALSTLASIEIASNYDNAAAIQYVERALTVSPGDSNALNTASGIAMIVGDYETGKKLSRSMALVDPLNTGAHLNYGHSAYFADDFDDAIESFERVIELNPDAAGLHYYIANILWAQGKYEQALERIQRENLDGYRYTSLAMLYFALGNIEASDAALASLNELNVEWAYQRVMVYSVRGEKDKAFEWIDTAIEIRDRGLNLAVGDPALDNLREDPRFADVLKRLNRTAVR